MATPAGELLVSEVFSAIQGEGALVGRRQVFLRLTGCNVRCVYCDQPEALEKVAGPCRLERTPGRRDWEHRQSPLPYADVVDAVDRLWQALPHHSVSLTGGEPLLQADRLAEVAPLLKARGHRLYLETNGTLVGGLRKVLPWIDEVGMDLKLTSVDHERIALDVHRRFLSSVVDAGIDVFLKVVVGPATDVDELLTAVDAARDVAPSAPLYLQPLTPFGVADAAPTAEQVLEWHDAALRRHPDVRVVPQTHKMIGQL